MTHPAAFADAFDEVVDVFVRAIESDSEPLMFAAGARFKHLLTLTDEPREVVLRKVQDAAAAKVVATYESDRDN